VDSDHNAYANSNGHGYGYSNAYANSNGHGYADPNAYRDTHPCSIGNLACCEGGCEQ